MNLILLSLAVLALLPHAFAFFGMNKHNRVIWRGLPETEGDWVAGQTVSVEWKFRRHRKHAGKYVLCLKKFWYKHCFWDNRPQENRDLNGYYKVEIKLPEDLHSNDKYFFELKDLGLFGGDDDEFAISYQFPIISAKEKHEKDLAAQKAMAPPVVSPALVDPAVMNVTLPVVVTPLTPLTDPMNASQANAQEVAATIPLVPVAVQPQSAAPSTDAPVVAKPEAATALESSAPMKDRVMNNIKDTVNNVATSTSEQIQKLRAKFSGGQAGLSNTAW